jgi:hypothetical protein
VRLSPTQMIKKEGWKRRRDDDEMMMCGDVML